MHITKTQPPVVQPGTGNNIIINSNQRLNPVLDHVRNVGKEFGDIVPDYQVGRTTCILFLSNEEAGQYISTFKQFEHKPPDLIKERVDKDYESTLRTSLTSISKVNKTDAETLRTSLGSFADIARTPSDRLQSLPGFGHVKVKRIKEAFEKPFLDKAPNSALSLLRSANSGEMSTLGTQPKASMVKGQDVDVPQTPPLLIQSPGWDARKPRLPSPAWDIDLDLNESDSCGWEMTGSNF
ncbi:hypothetical protein ID866_8939 [Astraeus odoratus]|nr:hypothetical protein ID866_8939 [Astraeus odoratus]